MADVVAGILCDMRCGRCASHFLGRRSCDRHSARLAEFSLATAGSVFRYALIGVAVYVIFKTLRVPLVSMVVGLCALGAATIAASVYEILRPAE